MVRLLAVAVLALAALTPVAARADTGCTRTVPVSGNAALSSALSSAKSGDCIVVADGTYSAPRISVSGISVAAAHPLKAGFTSGTVQVTGSHVVVSGFTFTGKANFQFNDSVGSQLTRSYFHSSAADFVDVFGQHAS